MRNMNDSAEQIVVWLAYEKRKRDEAQREIEHLLEVLAAKFKTVS
jgi:hypothetical protein